MCNKTKMDRVHRDILKDLRRNIVVDMDVYNGVINPLKSEHILRDEDIEQIKTGKSKQERAQILLDILPSRGPFAFDSFREALRHHYVWISEDMDKLEASRKSVYHTKYSGSPNLPPLTLTVPRKEKMCELKLALESLEPERYVVLHGMKGFGKSCLTASMLKDTKLVRNLFNDEVYWIKFGNTRSVEEEILIQLNKLYHLVKNLETFTEPLKPEPLKDFLILFITRHFHNEDHRNALLILDDVCHKDIIDAFDFGCKTLVITADVEVLLDRRPAVIKMADGFTETETLGLFANVLETEVEKLPPEARKIHQECGGMPLLITMFSAQFAEFKHDMNRYSHRWKYYLNSLKEKDVTNKVIKQFFEKQEAIFNMCINQLSADMKKRYEELAIFSEDVNIMPQTLEILWEGRPYQVEDMMLDFCRKSLAVKQWNDDLGSYIYGIHDLLLCHLRKNLQSEKLVEMHKSLIQKYRKYCNNDFSKLPQDDYSHSYIGHHLEQAQMFDEFPKIYFNFDFLQSVIIHTGLYNLLIDLEKYRKFITKNNDPAYEEQLLDLEKFLEQQASVIAEHRRKKCLDLIQIAMNHSPSGFVQNTAYKLAMERTQKLYLRHGKKLGQIDVTSTQEIPTKACSARFACDPHLILIGNEKGEVYLWDSLFKKQKVFSGHMKKSIIKKILVSAEGDCFLTLSDDGVAKLFVLNDDYLDENHHTQSPRQKQVFWSNLFQSKICQDDSVALFSVKNEIISDVTFGRKDTCIAACTDEGSICVWDRGGNILFNCNHTAQTCSLKSIAFTTVSDLLHIMDEANGVLISYGRSVNGYKYLAQYNPGLQQKKIIFFTSIPEPNSLIIVTEDRAIYVKWVQNDAQLHSYKKQIRASVENEKTVYVCAALTSDGQYIVLADSAGFINVWNTDVGYEPIIAYKTRVSSLDTVWLKEEGYHVICGGENRVLHTWKLVEKSQVSIKKPLFDAIVRPIRELDIITTQTLANSVVTFLGDRIIAESEPVDGKIINLHLSSDGSTVVYVTEKGIVTLFDVLMNKGTAILKLSPTIEFIKILNIGGDKVVVCRGGNNDLKVWLNIETVYLVENAGSIIAIHEINENCLITISQDGVISIWKINGTRWLRVHKVVAFTSMLVDATRNFSCLSYSKNLLAICSETSEAILYNLQEDTFVLPVHLKIIENFRKSFSHKITCCEISQDEKYLALGYETGSISIVDIQLKEEIRKLCFHTTAVTQLYWAPCNIGVPVLLSVSEDELVWWNIALAVYSNKQKRRSRILMKRSYSTPLVSRADLTLQLSTSQSAGANGLGIEQSVAQEQQAESAVVENGTCIYKKYWKDKEGKDPEQPALLAVVQLPHNFLAKPDPDFRMLIGQF